MNVEIRSKQITIVPINSLLPHPKNMHEHPAEQIDRLCKLIEYQGFRNPIIVQEGTNLIVAGHGRIMAAKKLGIKEVPVIYQEFESEAQLYSYIVSDNAIGKDTWATLDLSKINTEMLDLGPDFDIDLLGIKDFVIEPIEKFEPESDEDDVPEVEKPITVRGDIWLLGKHRLMCGDSTMIDDVDKLMNGDDVEFVHTDPPYGMHLDTDYTSMGASSKKHNTVIGDGDDFKPELISTIFATASKAKEMFIWGADYFAEHLNNKNEGSWLVWDKRSSEDDIGKMDGQFGSSFELCWSKSKHKREIIRFTRPTSFWRGDESSVHPTQKPVEVIEWIFKRYDGNRVLDLYCGSGSTIIACEKTNRKCYGMELDEKYCDVIINRWQSYTGKKATLESTGQTYEELKAIRNGG